MQRDQCRDSSDPPNSYFSDEMFGYSNLTRLRISFINYSQRIKANCT